MINSATARRRFRIVRDEFAESPLEEECRVGRFVFTESNRYFSGDDHKHASDVGEEVRKSRPFAKLPVYAYVHSGVTIWTEGGDQPCIPGAHQGWDSGLAGYIIAEFKSCRDAFGRGFTKAQVLDCLRAEVQTYDHYLRGDYCGYVVEDEDGEVVDSCYGYESYESAKADVKRAYPDAEEAE